VITLALSDTIPHKSTHNYIFCDYLCIDYGE
jgi:hypothetical protein